MACQLHSIVSPKRVAIGQRQRYVQRRVRERLYEKLALRMPTKSFYQFAGRVIRNLATTLAAPDCSPELDLCQRQDGKSMPRVICGESKKSLRAGLIDVQLDEGARF